MTPLDMTLCDAVDAIKAGRISCLELLEESLQAIRRLNSTLNAVIAVDEERGLEEAKRLDALPHDQRGLLHGVPLAHKDMFDRKGSISTFGAPKIYHKIATTTAGLLQRLDAAGAISVARLNMAELAMGPTGHNDTFGRCMNPYNTQRITGGSSSGSGAAVSARLVFGSLGSDTGGSVRIPAAACGIAGLKPTQNLMDMTGVMPLSYSLDCPGPLARNSRDIARMMDVLSNGRHEREIAAPITGLVVGIPDTYYHDDLDTDVAATFEGAIDTFRALGCKIRSVAIPPQDMLPHYADILWKSEAASLHFSKLAPGPDQLGEQVRSRLVQGLATSAIDYIDILKLRAIVLDQMISGPFQQCDVLLTPAMPCVVPPAVDVSTTTGEKMRLNLEAISRFTRPLSFLGLPCLVTPAGQDRDNMPVAIQLVGRPNAEPILLRIGHHFEIATRHNVPAPAL